MTAKIQRASNTRKEVRPLAKMRSLKPGHALDGFVISKTRSQHIVVKLTVKKKEFGKVVRDSDSHPLRASP